MISIIKNLHLTGDLTGIGNCINKYRKQKLIMAPGSEPDTVVRIFGLLEPFVSGMALAGLLKVGPVFFPKIIH